MIKILIADDSKFSQKVTANLIRKYITDSDIYFADDGQEAYKKYIEINPDYIFADLLMPNVNGEELIKLIKKHNSNAKIIVISADVQKDVRREIESYNVMSFINKPFNEEKARLVYNMIRNDEKNER